MFEQQRVLFAIVQKGNSFRNFSCCQGILHPKTDIIPGKDRLITSDADIIISTSSRGAGAGDIPQVQQAGIAVQQQLSVQFLVSLTRTLVHRNNLVEQIQEKKHDICPKIEALHSPPPPTM